MSGESVMTEPRITRDREEIEAWANEHDAIPIREGDRIRLVPRSDVGETHERLEWGAFHQEMDEQTTS